MALRTVVTEGDEILRKHCRPVGDVTPRIKETLEDMVETMRYNKGVGLAGPQIGVMRRMFVAEPDPEEGRVYYMIDPVILEEEGSVIDNEACLSVPDLVGKVERPQKIRMKATDMEGNESEYEFEDFAARVMCHEMDHLEGTLYTDKALELFEPAEEEEETEE